MDTTVRTAAPLQGSESEMFFRILRDMSEGIPILMSFIILKTTSLSIRDIGLRVIHYVLGEAATFLRYLI